jgi:hypothetical protein
MPEMKLLDYTQSLCLNRITIVFVDFVKKNTNLASGPLTPLFAVVKLSPPKSATALRRSLAAFERQSVRRFGQIF